MATETRWIGGRLWRIVPSSGEWSSRKIEGSHTANPRTSLISSTSTIHKEHHRHRTLSLPSIFSDPRREAFIPLATYVALLQLVGDFLQSDHSIPTMALHVHARESFPSDETSACTPPTTKPPRRRRRRPARRRSDGTSSMITLACIISMVLCPDGVFGFVPAQNVAYRRRTENTMSLRMSSVAVAGVESQGRRRSSFKDRMRNIVVRDRKRSADAKVGGKNGRPSNVKVVRTLEDYKIAVGDERDKLVVVRFYATWCKVSQVQWKESG